MGPVAYMASTKLLVGFLGILLAFAPSCSTAPTTTPAPAGACRRCDDQHVAGLIMALEQSIVMGIALAWLFVRMLSESDEEDERLERYSA